MARRRARAREKYWEGASHKCMGAMSVDWWIEHSKVVNMLEAHMAARYAHTHSKDEVRTRVWYCKSQEE